MGDLCDFLPLFWSICVERECLFSYQGLDGEATEPMIKELEDEREESQDPEVEFAIAGAVRECGGLEIILSMIQVIMLRYRSFFCCPCNMLRSINLYRFIYAGTFLIICKIFLKKYYIFEYYFT